MTRPNNTIRLFALLAATLFVAAGTGCGEKQSATNGTGAGANVTAPPPSAPAGPSAPQPLERGAQSSKPPVPVQAGDARSNVATPDMISKMSHK